MVVRMQLKTFKGI